MKRALFVLAPVLVTSAVRAQELPDHHFPLLSANFPSAYTVRGCIADKACPVKAHALFPCGTSEESAALRICAIVKEGRRIVSPFRVVHQGEREGGNCGSWFLVTCFDPPDVGMDERAARPMRPVATAGPASGDVGKSRPAAKYPIPAQ